MRERRAWASARTACCACSPRGVGWGRDGSAMGPQWGVRATGIWAGRSRAGMSRLSDGWGAVGRGTRGAGSSLRNVRARKYRGSCGGLGVGCVWMGRSASSCCLGPRGHVRKVHVTLRDDGRDPRDQTHRAPWSSEAFLCIAVHGRTVLRLRLYLSYKL